MKRCLDGAVVVRVCRHAGNLALQSYFTLCALRLHNRRWTCVQYAALTRLSALRWERLVRAGRACRLRVLQAELMVAFGPSLAEMQAYMRRHVWERRNTL